MPSHPIQLASSVPVHSDASPAKSRRVPPSRVPRLEPFASRSPEALTAATSDCALMRALLASRQRRSTAAQQLRERLDELARRRPRAGRR